MDNNILQKYNVPVPRYTSYPPANYFDTAFGNEKYLKALEFSNEWQPAHISVYLHIPFCRHMCHYCGCNSYPIRNRVRVDEYVAALKKELQMVLSRLDPSRRISQIHYGGGTPTVLSPDILKELNDSIFARFDSIDRPEIAIECHPGYLDAAYWKALASAGFNRVSIGIQDFNDKVLDTVHRRPSLLEPEEIFAILRSAGISINLDFIYGLPFQTAAGFEETIGKAIGLAPDRIVTFSYAHVPWVNPNMKKLEVFGLPSGIEKQQMFEQASQLLNDSGYRSVGMDHFVRENDELFTASRDRTLHRNFQGYCTRRTTGQVYAFGVSGISQLAGAYAQNTKNIDEYVRRIEAGEPAVERGYELSPDMQFTREIITRLMCNEQIVWEELADYYGIPADEIRNRLEYRPSQMEGFIKDGIVTVTDEGIYMTKEGSIFVRNVAASFDKLSAGSTKSFSKPL